MDINCFSFKLLKILLYKIFLTYYINLISICQSQFYVTFYFFLYKLQTINLNFVIQGLKRQQWNILGGV